MRRLLILAAALIAVIALWTVGVVFDSSSHDEDNASPAAAKLALDGDSFNLGEVPATRTVERTVTFRNSGSAPLNVSIAKVRPAPDAACGCGVERFEVRPEVVPPGGSGELLFKLKVPEGMESMTDKMLAELQSNDPDRPNLTITLIFEMSE